MRTPRAGKVSTRKALLSDDHTFELIMSRFDKVDKDNQDIQTSMTQHVVEDTKIHDIVKKHSTYWGLLLKIGGASVAALTAWWMK